MNKLASFFLITGSVALFASCDRGRDAEDPSEYNAQQQPQQGGYQQQPGQYTPQPGYGGQQPQPQQTTTPPGAAGAPSPLALPCQSDITCGAHKCNLSVGKCAWPCAVNTDCAAGFSCFGAGSPTAICVPGGG